MNELRLNFSSRAGRTFTRMTSTVIVGLIVTSLTGCGGGGGGEGTPGISTSATPTGAMATLAWDPVQDPTVTAYYVHYGKQSAGQPGTCNYQDSQFVNAPNATITGLDPNTRYYFAVSAYNGLESACSNEVTTVTPASQT